MSTLSLLLTIPSMDSRMITTDAVAIMHESITMATGSKRVRPTRKEHRSDEG